MRSRFEQTLRVIVIVSLLAMLWLSLRSADTRSPLSADARDINQSKLRDWTTRARSRIRLALDGVPDRSQRAWLSALAGAGTSVTWSGNVTALMIDTQPIAAPTGGTRVTVAAPPASRIVLSDEIGTLDTLQLRNAGATVALPANAARVVAASRSSLASTTQPDSSLLRRVLVIGSATWESKFVVAALEEEGWKVDASIRVAPGTDVDQGSATPIDTAQYAAVIALDSAAAPYAGRIARFVQSGGGVILTSETAALDAMSTLRAGLPRAEIRSSAQPQISLSSLPVSPIALKDDAVSLEKRGAATTMAARRFAAGRVLQVGYKDSWRWRLNGGDNGLRDHRLWWTNLVSNVAYAPRIPRATSVTSSAVGPDDVAPVADLVARLGPAAVDDHRAPERSSSDWMRLLFALTLAALIAEVASRRLRGAA